MIDLLIETIETIGYSVKRQGSLLENEPYPDHFFTFFTNSTDGTSFYDNNENVIVWNFDLNFYSIDPMLMNTQLSEAKKLLKQRGFIITGIGHDVMSDEPSHTGKGITVWFRENL